MIARCHKSKLRLHFLEFLKHFFILNCRYVNGPPGTRLSPPHLDNTYDYGDNCTYFISLIIKVGVMITPFGGYACGWLTIFIYP